MPETAKTSYKKTLNLPKTSFPMRAGLTQHEPESLARWDRMRLYDTVLETRSGGEPFVFHDGPPYANGLIHVGHLLNKVLKDLVVRSRLMSGRQCPFVPGWDCHGLPIEHRVMTDLLESGRIEKLNTLADDERRMAVRRECRAYAEKYQKLQGEQLKRLLTLADYEHPYLTLTPDYEAAVLEVFARLVEEGVVYRALKSVHWSVENQTALAEAELEYHEREDLSVPGEPYTFGVLKQAQALGDFEAMRDKGRRILRLHLRGDLEQALQHVAGLIDEVGAALR